MVTTWVSSSTARPIPVQKARWLARKSAASRSPSASGECERVRNVGEPDDLHAGHHEGADVEAVVVDHGQVLADVLDGLRLGFVVHQQACSGPLSAVQHEVDEALADGTRRPELHHPKAIASREHHRTLLNPYHRPNGDDGHG